MDVIVGSLVDGLISEAPMTESVLQNPLALSRSAASISSCRDARLERAMRKPTCKATIRKALRRIYEEAGENPPNVNRAWDLVKVLLPNATRSRVREVLREAEFAQRRHGPGRKARTRSPEPTTPQEAAAAI